MKIEAKPRTIVTVVLVIAIVVAGYFYLQKTKSVRTYKAELKKLRIIEEHQRLEIEVVKQRAILESMKKDIEDAVPKYELTPIEDPNK